MDAPDGLAVACADEDFKKFRPRLLPGRANRYIARHQRRITVVGRWAGQAGNY
jgi:hypothetical protein